MAYRSTLNKSRRSNAQQHSTLHEYSQSRDYLQNPQKTATCHLSQLHGLDPINIFANIPIPTDKDMEITIGRSPNISIADVQRASFLKQEAERLSARVLSHPFLVACRCGAVPFESLKRFLIQHGKYSAYFTRYLCALISRLQKGSDVLELAKNLAEELGLGSDDGGVPHSQLYAELLARFDIAIDAHPAWPETQNQIETVFMLCQQPDGVAGLGALCLGAEAIVPGMYASIIEGFMHHGIAEDSLEFFRLHVACDDGHAETMYRLLGVLADSAPDALLCAVQAGEIAVNARLRVFDKIERLGNAV